MAKRLNEDGLPTEVPTVASKQADVFERKAEEAPSVQPVSESEEPPTRPGKRQGLGGNDPFLFSTGDQPRTRIHVGARTKREIPVESSSGPDAMDDPVVGWLVIIGGPGKGSALRLGSGQNSVGRGTQARVRIDFGDQEISRGVHTVVTYDPKHNKFYVQQGAGTNLTYLGDQPVLSPTVLMSGDRIAIGQTTLRFSAFCDADFCW